MITIPGVLPGSSALLPDTINLSRPAIHAKRLCDFGDIVSIIISIYAFHSIASHRVQSFSSIDNVKTICHGGTEALIKSKLFFTAEDAEDGNVKSCSLC